jgi:hypothetical protein
VTRAWWRAHVTAVHLTLVTIASLLWHSPATMLRTPYWLDEAWVADSLRAPVSDLARLTSSSPIGFTFLLRLVPTVFGDQRSRLVPLLFAAAIAPVAYLLGRELDRESRLTAVLFGCAAVVLPGVMRHDLKQYPADAFVAVCLLLLTARAERLRTRRALAQLTAAAAAGLLVSHTTALVAAAAYSALVVAYATRRQWRDLLESAIAGAVFVVALGVDYALLARRGHTPALTHYWEPFYIPRNGKAWAFVRDQGASAVHYVGPRNVYVAFALVLFGCVALWLSGRRATALLLPALTVGMLMAAYAWLYPLWDGRTSAFFFAVETLVAVAGVAWAARWLATRWRPAGALLAVAALAGLTGASVRLDQPIVPDGTATGTRWIAARRQPGDLVLVDSRLAYVFAYYWHADRPHWVAAPYRTVGFEPDYAPRATVRVVRDAGTPSGPASVATYLAESPTGQVWFLLSRRNLYAAYLAAARAAGSTEVLTDDDMYVAIRVRRA